MSLFVTGSSLGASLVLALQMPGQTLEEVRDRATQITALISPAAVLLILLILVATYYLNQLIGFVLERLAGRLTRHRPRLLQLAAVTRIGLWLFAVYVSVVGVVQPSREALIALAATTGLGIGFAAQDILKNIFGGIVILLDRPFQVGDLIDVGPHHGEVKGIGLRATLVLTRDDTLVAVPNAEIVSQSVRNANSGALDCLVVTELHVPAFADPAAVRRIAFEAAATSPYLYATKPITVQFVDTVQGNRFVTRVFVRAYVYDHRLEVPFKTDVAERAKQALLQAGLVAEDDLPGLERSRVEAAVAGGVAK